MARTFSRGVRRTFLRASKFQRARTSWVNTVFNSSALNAGGNISENVLLEAADWGGSVVGVDKNAHVKRVIITGGLNFMPVRETTQNVDVLGCVCALYRLDNDDTDNTIVSTGANTIWGERMFWTRMYSAAFTTAVSTNTNQIDGINFDLNVDLPVKFVMRPDQLLLFGMQLNGNFNARLQITAARMVTRVLIEQP